MRIAPIVRLQLLYNLALGEVGIIGIEESDKREGQEHTPLVFTSRHARNSQLKSQTGGTVRYDDK